MATYYTCAFYPPENKNKNKEEHCCGTMVIIPPREEQNALRVCHQKKMQGEHGHSDTSALVKMTEHRKEKVK